MNWIQKLGAKAFGFNVVGQNSNNLSFTINTAGEWVYSESSKAYINDGYKGLPNVYAIISTITDKSKSVPFEIFKKKSEQKYRKYKSSLANCHSAKDYTRVIKLKNEALEKVEGTELEQLLNKPNNYTSTEQLFEEIDGYTLLTGNSIVYQLSLTEGGKPKELHSIPSPLVDLIVKGTPFEPEFNYKVGYLQNMLGNDEVLHFKTFNPVTDYSTPGRQHWGQSPLKSCEKLLGRYKDADITQGFQFKNMGPAGMISGGSTNPDTNLTEEQAIAVQDRFDQQHKGTYSAGKILVTPSNLKWVNFGLSPSDLNILESKQEILAELCNVYKVPIGMFSSKNSTENNMIESRKAMITDAVIPLVERRKSVLQHRLLPKFGDDLVIEFDYTVFPEMQEDLEKLSKVYSQMDWVTDNERRSATGYDRYDNEAADIIYKNQGLVPIQDLGLNIDNPDMVDENLLNDD